MRNRRLSRAIADMRFWLAAPQACVQGGVAGCHVVAADRWHPSSKTCSRYGYRLEAITLNKGQWTCLGCEMHHERDVNAAINLRIMALRSTVSACEEESTGRARKRRGEARPAKQESGDKGAQDSIG